MRFEWNSSKAARNLRKHRISFDEAVTVFHDPFAATFSDPDHSVGERRHITVGRSSTGQLLIVIHVERGTVIRIISARPASANERKRHEA